MISYKKVLISFVIATTALLQTTGCIYTGVHTENLQEQPRIVYYETSPISVEDELHDVVTLDYIVKLYEFKESLGLTEGSPPTAIDYYIQKGLIQDTDLYKEITIAEAMRILVKDFGLTDNRKSAIKGLEYLPKEQAEAVTIAYNKKLLDNVLLVPQIYKTQKLSKADLIRLVDNLNKNRYSLVPDLAKREKELYEKVQAKEIDISKNQPVVKATKPTNTNNTTASNTSKKTSTSTTKTGTSTSTGKTNTGTNKTNTSTPKTGTSTPKTGTNKTNTSTPKTGTSTPKTGTSKTSTSKQKGGSLTGANRMLDTDAKTKTLKLSNGKTANVPIDKIGIYPDKVNFLLINWEGEYSISSKKRERILTYGTGFKPEAFIMSGLNCDEIPLKRHERISREEYERFWHSLPPDMGINADDILKETSYIKQKEGYMQPEIYETKSGIIMYNHSLCGGSVYETQYYYEYSLHLVGTPDEEKMVKAQAKLFFLQIGLTEKDLNIVYEYKKKLDNTYKPNYMCAYLKLGQYTIRLDVNHDIIYVFKP